MLNWMIDVSLKRVGLPITPMLACLFVISREINTTDCMNFKQVYEPYSGSVAALSLAFILTFR